ACYHPRIATQKRHQNLRTFLNLLFIFAAVLGLYSVLFQELMAREGATHSWLTGVYWTLPTMSTLRYGDVVFTSDAGRMFSMIVLVTGMIFLFVLLPFTLIPLLYAPWLRAPHPPP